MPKITYFADPMCSWCYGFSPVISKLREELEGKFDFELVMGGLRANDQPMTASERNDTIEHWREVEAKTGAAFNYENALPEGFVYDTTLACKAVSILSRQFPEFAWTYLDSVHVAFYADGTDVTLQANLVDIGVQYGMSGLNFWDALDSEDAERAFQEDRQKAAANEVTGYPSILLEMDDYSRLIMIGYEPYESVVEKLLLATERQLSKELESAEAEA